MIPDHKWVSARAVAWVIHEAPVPADLFPVLTVIAAACDEHGRGCYQSIPTIGALTGKSPYQARRDVERLFDLGLIRLGDQSLTNHLSAGQRPVVYDVAMDVRGPKPAKVSKNPSGRKKDVPADETPSIHATPGMDARGADSAPVQNLHPSGFRTPGMDATPTPGMDAGGTPGMDATPPLASMPPKQPVKNPSNNPGNNPESGGSSHVPTGFARETDDDFSISNQTPDDPGGPDVLGAPLASLATPEHSTPETADEDTPPVVAEVETLDDEKPPPPPVARPRPPRDDEAPQPDPRAAAARAALARRGDFGEWIAAARQQLGADAPRDQVFILAAELADAEPDAADLAPALP